MKHCEWLPFVVLGMLGSFQEAAAAPPASVPRTGQTYCRDEAGNGIPCDLPQSDPLYGQNGQFQRGVAWPVPRFVALVIPANDTGTGGGIAGNRRCDGAEICNGAIRDRLTDLIWLAKGDCVGRVKWPVALKRSSELASGQCGLRDGSRPGDWRLPNVKELQSLIDYECESPAIADQIGNGCLAADPHPIFSSIQPQYWSSTSVPRIPFYAFRVSLGGGGIYNYAVDIGLKSDYLNFLPVRNFR